MDPGVVEQPAHVVVRLVVEHQVEDEVQHELPAHGLVPVHVGHILDVGLAHHVLVGRPGDHHDPELAALDALPNGVERGQVGVDRAHVTEERRH